MAARLRGVPNRRRASLQSPLSLTRERTAYAQTDKPDVVLIGAGIMSATLGTVLKELDPSLSIAMFETLEDAGWKAPRRGTTPAPATPPIAR